MWILLSMILFFFLTPGILLRLPSKGSKYVVAAVHAFVFGLLLLLGKMFILKHKEGLVSTGGKTSSPTKTKINDIFNNSKTLQGLFTKAFVGAPQGSASITSDTNTVRKRGDAMKSINNYVNTLNTINIKPTPTDQDLNDATNLQLIVYDNARVPPSEALAYWKNQVGK